MYSQKHSRENFKRLGNYGNNTFNYVVGSYEPNECDVQYDLVRVQNSPFNPWAPVKQEVWTNYYNQEDPWAAERQKEQSMRQQRVSGGPYVPTSRGVLPQGGQPNPNVPVQNQQQFMNRMMGNQLGQPRDVQFNQDGEVAVNDPRRKVFFDVPGTCPSCVEGNSDCMDTTTFACFAPACSTMKPCIRDANYYVNRPPQVNSVVIAPII